jgi:hypothetical protein
VCDDVFENCKVSSIERDGDARLHDAVASPRNFKRPFFNPAVELRDEYSLFL